MLDRTEFKRWIESARRTLESAKRDMQHNDHNWACFKAHQAAEKALKALLWGTGKPRIGHSLTKLLEYIEVELGIEVSEEVREACIRLNKFYTPTRYPDAWSEGIPEEYYSRSEAEEAISQAQQVIEWVMKTWERLLKRGKEDGREH